MLALALLLALSPGFAPGELASLHLQNSQEKKTPPEPEEAEAALERALTEAGNDRATLVRNLRAYLARFPDSPRKVQVYRAIIEASLQLEDADTAIEYAERLIAIRPDDSSMMLLAVDLLERGGGEHNLTKAVGYITRVLDRVEKAAAEGRPSGAAGEEWVFQQKKLVMSVYLIRGRLELERRRYDQAQADLQKSFDTLPNAAAAMRLGEIAELRRLYDTAIERYITAFALPESHGADVDRREVRQKLGNVWRIVHGSDAGLGERLLAAYDQLSAESAAEPPARNAQAKTLADFELRRPDGSLVKLADLRGKVLMLNFWATWCSPCREIEPIFARVAGQFRDNSGVVFLAASADRDESLVVPYLEREKVKTPVVFADGLERFFSVSILPTLLVLDRDGRIIYRGEGFTADTLEKELSAAIERALAGKKD